MYVCVCLKFGPNAKSQLCFRTKFPDICYEKLRVTLTRTESENNEYSLTNNNIIIEFILAIKNPTNTSTRHSDS